jgi:ATP-binding cassette, subfamily B, bacterial
MRDREYSSIYLYRRLLGEARPFWGHVALLFVGSLLSTPLALLTPLPLKIAVDSVIERKALPRFLDFLPSSVTETTSGLLLVTIGLLIGIRLLAQLQSLFTELLGAYTGEKLVLRLRAALFRHVQRLSLSYHDVRGTSDSVYRIQYDAPAIRWIVIQGVTPFITAGVTLVGMIVVTARIDWQLAVVALTVSPVLFVITSVSRRTLRRAWRVEKDLDSLAMSVVQEVLGGLRIVKTFGQEEREHQRFVLRSDEGTRQRIRLALTRLLFSMLTGLTIAGGTATVLYIGVRHVQSGVLTLGSLLVVMAYLAQLYQPLQTMSSGIGTLQASLASAERAFYLLDQEADVKELPHARPLRRARGAIEFRDVSFAYGEGRPVLDNVSFSIPPGASLAVAGKTGSGKSTIASLITRLYDPTAGQILLDGVDVREFRVADLRDQFALVLQDSILFSTSIAENIAYGRPGSSHADIVAAAKAAGADEFVRQLPDKYDTVVGERGMTLSGGERQRISLARAFLKDAPVLILDEPTSAVDTATEAQMIEAIERLMRGRTVVMIAHRLSTLAGCDAFIQLVDGRIVSTARPVEPATMKLEARRRS